MLRKQKRTNPLQKDTKVNSKDKKVAETKPVSKYQKGLAAYIRGKNKNLSKEWSIKLAGYFIKSGKKNKIDPKVLMALAQRESNFRAKARSKYGYKGMMQCTSSFAEGLWIQGHRNCTRQMSALKSLPDICER